MMNKLLWLSLLWMAPFKSSFAVKTYTAFTVDVTGTGQPLLLIPGATCSGNEWDETVAHYKGQFQFHVFTLAGYAGLPPIKNGLYLDSFKTQIEQYISDNRLSHVILAGHSIGGFLSLWIGTDRLPAIEKIVIVDALPFFAGITNPAAVDGFSEEMAKKMLLNYRSMNDSMMFRSQLTAAKYLCNDSTHWIQIARWGVQSDKKTMAYSIAEMMGHDLRRALGSIRIPVLVLAAYSETPQFPGYTRDYALKAYTQQYANCTVCTLDMPLGGTKHFIMYDNPTWMYTELDKFFAIR